MMPILSSVIAPSDDKVSTMTTLGIQSIDFLCVIVPALKHEAQ